MLQQLHHQAAASILQDANLSQASVAMHEMEFRGRALRWIKNFKSNLMKEIANFGQEEELQSSKPQDRELKEIMTSQDEEDINQKKRGYGQ